MAPKKKRKADSSVQEGVCTSTPEDDPVKQFLANASHIYENKKYDFDVDIRPIFSGVKNSKVVEQQLVAKLLELQVCNHQLRSGIGIFRLESDNTDIFLYGMQTTIKSLHAAIDCARNVAQEHRRSGVSEVLAYSHRISYTAAAPPDYIPGKSMLYAMKAPAPQQIQLQSSILHTLQDRSKDGALYHEKEASAPTEQKIGAIEKETSTKANGRADALMPDLAIDADLLKQLPPMPKEWKPGDPIPGLDALLKKKENRTIEKSEEKKEIEKKPAAFAFALNPDMDIEFGAGDSSSEEDSDDF